MIKEITKPGVSLESISKSIQLIIMRMGSFATKHEINLLVGSLVTKEEVTQLIEPLIKPLATQNEINDLRSEIKDLIGPLITKAEVVEMIKPLATSQLVDDLAIAVKNGFDRVDKRFEEVGQRFNGVDERFDNLDQKVTRIGSKFSNAIDNILIHYSRREEFDHLDVRCKKLERRVFA